MGRAGGQGGACRVGGMAVGAAEGLWGPGRQRPAGPAPDLEVRRHGEPEARWRPVVAGPPGHSSLPTCPPTGGRGRRGLIRGALPRSAGTRGPAPGRPALARPGMLPGPPPPRAPAPSSQHPLPPPELPLPAGREAAGGGLVNPGVLETAQVRREQCPVVAPRGWGATPRHQPHVAKPLACPRFRPAGPWGLRPGTGTSSLDTEAIDGGIKAACVGTERRASPCPAARHRHSCQVAWAGTARQWGLCGDEDRPARGRTALSLASGETREARPPPGAAVGASRGVPRSRDMAEQEERAPRAPGQTRGHSGDDSLRTRGPVPVNTPQRGTLPGPRTATGGAGGSRERTAGTCTATSLQSAVTARPLSPMSPTVSPRLLGAERMDVATPASLGH